MDIHSEKILIFILYMIFKINYSCIFSHALKNY